MKYFRVTYGVGPQSRHVVHLEGSSVLNVLPSGREKGSTGRMKKGERKTEENTTSPRIVMVSIYDI